MNQNELRKKLCTIIENGLMAKAIYIKTGIGPGVVVHTFNPFSI